MTSTSLPRYGFPAQISDVASRDIWVFLFGDGLVRLTAFLVAILGGIHLLNQFGFGIPIRSALLTPSIVLIALSFIATLGRSAPRESGLWRRLMVAYGLWLLVEVFSHLTSHQAPSHTTVFLVDCGYVAFFTMVLLAVERRDVQPSKLNTAQRGARLADQVSIIVLVVSLLAYFVLIPNRYDPSVFPTAVPSYLLYTILDFIIGARLLHVASKSRVIRWRFFAILSGIAFLAWGFIDLIDAVGSALDRPFLSGTVFDMLWYAPFLLVVCAHRLRLFPVIKPLADDQKGVEELDPARGFPLVGVIALVLVVVHIAGYGLGFFEQPSRGPREVLIILLVLMAVVSVTSRRAISESAALTKRLSLGIEQGADSVIITDSDGIIEYVNQAFVKTTGYSREEAVGANPKILSSGHHEPHFFEELWRTIKGGEVFQDTFTNRRKNGSIYFDERVISPLIDGKGRITHYVATGRDITGRIEDQRRLQYMATHDVLTGLPNRSLFQERLEHAINISKRHDRRLAVLFVDLDDFKTINDTHGHQRGDDVLRMVANRIDFITREGDTSGRVGGDEFMVLVEEIVEAEAVTALAERVIEAIKRPFSIDDQELTVTGSLGIAVYPVDGRDPQTLIGNADIAMYRAKDLGPGRVQFYSHGMTLPAVD